MARILTGGAPRNPATTKQPTTDTPTAPQTGGMPFLFDDGGRAAAGYRGLAGDCVCRAIAIATGTPYQEVYDALNEAGRTERRSKRRRGKSSARTGVHVATVRQFLEHQGFRWVPTMAIGQGCMVHLRPGELPMGRLIVSVSRHVVAVIDGVIHDTHDPSRAGTRCVYGYWTKHANRACIEESRA